MSSDNVTYANTTSARVGVCLATSGPGATNLVTGIADANSDSTPIVAITGNVPSHLLGKNAFQEVDIVGITRPITKMGHGAFPPGHDLSLHTLGMHGSRYANVAVNEADLVIAAGVRFDDRVTGKVDAFIAECGEHGAWLVYLAGLRQQFPCAVPQGEAITPQFAISLLNTVTAAGYRVRAERVSEPDQLAAAFERMLANPEEPYLLDVIVAAEENVYPMIPAGGSYRDIIMSVADMPTGARERQGSNV